MKVIAINGSPRKKWNTATLLKHALEGAASQGADTEMIHLYDLNYKGCISCFSCKLKSSKNYGKCIVEDDLMPIFKQVEKADAIILGSPIYMGSVTGEMRSFLERLLFSHIGYDAELSGLFKKKIPVGFIYTMNQDESGARSAGYFQHLGFAEGAIQRVFGSSESLFVYDTYQFDDYAKYVTDYFDPEAKRKQRDERFPNDCKKAFEMGVRFAMDKDC
jgi:multimeric flavodoxin WrbA